MASSTFPVHRSYGGSPSPSWPVSLSQGDHRRHHGRLPFVCFPLLVRGFTVAIMAGFPFPDKLQFFVESQGITVAIMAG